MVAMLPRSARLKAPTGSAHCLGTAERAGELNAALSHLWVAQGTYTRADFLAVIAPLYIRLLDALNDQASEWPVEAVVLELLGATARACIRRWQVRLPLQRPGSDYRKCELIYTDALVTAMAVDCLLAQSDIDPREAAAQAPRIVSEHLLTSLQADPMVWQDWLGYFHQAQCGGLYALASDRLRPHPPATAMLPKTRALPRERSPDPPPGSGWAMLDAIRTGLKTGAIPCNQRGDPVQVDGAGRTFLEHPQVLTWCANQQQLTEDRERLKRRFSRLKVLKRTTAGRQIFYGRYGKTDRRRVGYIIDSPGILWDGEVPCGSFVIEQLPVS
tara:strand:+ start:8239 stop:9225 length:987 start_codon:yes stop_codon:yes gene_type:complete